MRRIAHWRMENDGDDVGVKHLPFPGVSSVALLTLEFLVSILPFLDALMTPLRYLCPPHVRHLRKELVDLDIVGGVVHSQICHHHRKRDRRLCSILI